ncbi:hypothetical protein KIN20_021098 [Parelaphostrongylus tenuis]|uniref:Uncharacterized protein n=1 Tax=Parelaphostrongylus tenuis TaxID=148309 RepID=A0AAD5MS76_PARTN|nr:hypothetical protein KIN20_021098 [Parelaphostrongylus tenuis]
MAEEKNLSVKSDSDGRQRESNVKRIRHNRSTTRRDNSQDCNEYGSEIEEDEEEHISVRYTKTQYRYALYYTGYGQVRSVLMA